MKRKGTCIKEYKVLIDGNEIVINKGDECIVYQEKGQWYVDNGVYVIQIADSNLFFNHFSAELNLREAICVNETIAARITGGLIKIQEGSRIKFYNKQDDLLFFTNEKMQMCVLLDKDFEDNFRWFVEDNRKES